MKSVVLVVAEYKRKAQRAPLPLEDIQLTGRVTNNSCLNSSYKVDNKAGSKNGGNVDNILGHSQNSHKHQYFDQNSPNGHMIRTYWLLQSPKTNWIGLNNDDVCDAYYGRDIHKHVLHDCDV